MRGLPDRGWLRRTVLIAVITALVVGVVLATRGTEGGHRAANRAQLRKACDGTLPYGDLARLVPDGRRGELRQYGTMLAPDRDSRSLLDCSLSFGDGLGVTVHAEALVSDVPEEMKTRELLDPSGGEGTFVAPGTTGQYGRHGAWLVADCRGGLAGRARPTTDLYVRAEVTTEGGAEGGGRADRSGRERATALAGFRTAVHVANAITASQHCGGAPLPMPTDVVDTYEAHAKKGRWRSERIDEPSRDLRKCRWISGPSLRGVKSGRWTSLGDLQESGGLSACVGDWDEEAEENDGESAKEWEITGVEAASWSGILGRSAYDAYEREGNVPGWGADENADENADQKADQEADGKKDGPSEGESGPGGDKGEDRISSYASRPQLALWARSVCGGRATYHRVSVLPEVRFDDGDTAVLGAKDRARFSTVVRAVLDRYLRSDDAWPRSAGCRDTKVLGEVEQWH
ncbi:hypothetical protein HUT19_12655 [Streptomyces sp. NA02950]|uniref:hypothetical protein n=1 Tax=Streptomyces sp. NA02950 TaxID=2742137 RepID=UPI001591536B|nr:hypothetical protein [Streptomyces sp. NA02950]QKV92493.1 hypothetical protein HUT19_12655 [Streptomyces sp. NA02950]